MSARKKAATTEASSPMSPETAISRCIAGISLVEVVISSLDGQEIASCEQETLKAALVSLWEVHDFIEPLAQAGGGEETDATV